MKRKATLRKSFLLSAMATILLASPLMANESETIDGWLQWRGPQQNGTTQETNLPSRWIPGGQNDLWHIALKGRGTPVIAGNRVYVFGYRGEREELHEVLACLDAATGNTIWEQTFSDYISDVIYDRYSIGAPSIDAETGNVFLLTTAGEVHCFTADGEPVWNHPLMEKLGRMTFPNGRTGAVALDGDLAIIHVIASNWGKQGPPRDRFYAFDKTTGDLVWDSDPGAGPPFLKDSSFAPPVFETLSDGRRVFYCVLGDGNVVCVNARTGEAIWRFQQTVGGMNSAPIRYKDLVIAVHDVENVDVPKEGGMFAIRIDTASTSNGTVLPRDAMVWRNMDISAFSSSPVLVDDRLYIVDKRGVLHCVNPATGESIWSMKLGTDQIHASPLYGDGKLYVPMNEGLFYILRLNGDSTPDVLSRVELDGNCLGAPAIWNGRVYVFTTNHLYCFGYRDGNTSNLPSTATPTASPTPGTPVALQILPSEVLLRPGDSQTFRIRSIDARGVVVNDDVQDVTWEKFIPPTAKVKSKMDAEFQDGVLSANESAKASAGAFKASVRGLSGTIRGRILPRIPFEEDFESFDISVQHANEDLKFAYPPLPWIGARFKWEIRELDGNQVLAKTTDNLILQRAITFIGHPDESNYTIQADVRSDGNRRGMGDVGLIVQRYLVVLKGNQNQIEVSSNYERFRALHPFKTEPKRWYTLKARVDTHGDGSGVVRVKVWSRDEQEPEDWTFQVPHHRVHTQGSPGFFGLSSMPKFRVYIDNILITPND